MNREIKIVDPRPTYHVRGRTGNLFVTVHVWGGGKAPVHRIYSENLLSFFLSEFN